MGLFDKLRNVKPIELSPKAALALGGITIIGADGAIEDDEINSLLRMLRGDQQALDDAIRAYKELTIEQSVQVVAATLSHKQRIAFVANILDLAMADGILAPAEQQLLNVYVTALQLEESDLAGIIDVIALKNDFSVFASSSATAS